MTFPEVIFDMRGVERSWAIVVLLGMLLVACAPTTKAPRAKTELKLKGLERMFELLQATNSSTIVEQFRGIPIQTNLAAKVELLLVANARHLGFNSADIRFFLRDGYGKPMNFETKSNLSIFRASGELMLWPFEIVAWSSGSNGANEYGWGDDVVWKGNNHGNR